MDLRRSIVVVLLVGPLMACTHAMRIKNADDFTMTATCPKRLKIALKDAASGSDGHELVTAVQMALVMHPDVAQVVRVPAGTDKLDTDVDAVVELTPTTRYEGSGWNYLITFPGFLLFTHAWNGFIYEADIVTAVDVALTGEDATVHREIHTDYNLRYCDFDRGAAASSGWYLPGWGATNLIVGFFMVPYDGDATPMFLEKARSPYGNFIANSIIEAIDSGLEGTARTESALPIYARFASRQEAFVRTDAW